MSQQGMKRGNEGGAGGGAKKMRGDTLTLRFLVMSKHAGGIIGKGGQTIKRLRSEYSATVNVPDSNYQERVLSIGASQENVIKVLRECLPLFHEPPYPIATGNQLPKSPYEIDFLVHSSQVGGIIGRSGFKIKELRETTNTNIKVFQECLPNSTERVVALGGGEEEIVHALQQILEIMQESPIKGNVALYDPSQEEWNNQGGGGFDGNNFNAPPMGGGGNMRGGMRGGRGGGRGGGGGNFNSRGGFNGNSGGNGNFGGPMGGNQGNYGGPGNFGGDNNYNNFGGSGGGNQNFAGGAGGNSNTGADTSFGETQTTQVTIPNDLAGAIIGKGGERIRNIRQRSGADIKIEDPQSGKSDRVITLSGSAEQIQYGQFLMQQSVRQYSGKK